MDCRRARRSFRKRAKPSATNTRKGSATSAQPPIVRPTASDPPRRPMSGSTTRPVDIVEAARTSKLFAAVNGAATAPQAQSQETHPSTTPSSDELFGQNGQDRKLVFVNAAVDRRTTAPHRLTRPASPFVVQAGTVIQAPLITGIRSDLPGQITAQVTQNVYDSPSGRARLIPQGARPIGNYDSQVAFGQSRVLLVWTRLMMPDGYLDCTGAAAGSRCGWQFRP